MSYKVDLPSGDVEGYGCSKCGAVTRAGNLEYHALSCEYHDEHCCDADPHTHWEMKANRRAIRKQAFLEAAEMAENYETWNENILRFAKLLREKAEEE